jgi:hypothetical protein
MHPALSKAERKRYAGFDPDKWYPWTVEVSSEFTDLMRRSPRDTSFARGFAYVAQRAVPEGSYIPTTSLLQHIAQLPAAFRGPEGTGFDAQLDGSGHAIVRYAGMPGFANVCIAIQGELTQRLQASGAQSVVVKHGANCRVNGADCCEFEVEWSGETPPPDTTPANLGELVDAIAPAGRSDQPQHASAGGGPAQHAAAAAIHAAAPSPLDSATPSASASSSVAAASADLTDAQRGDAGGDDLFQQLRKRLAAADRQARLYAEAQKEIDALRVELSRVKAQSEADIAQASGEREEAVKAAAELKRRIREMVGEG